MTNDERPQNIFQVSACYQPAWRGGSEDVPQHVEINLYTETMEQAEEIVSRFPKSAKLRTGVLHNGYYGKPNSAYVTSRIQLLSDGVNGGRNETGIKRLASFFKKAEKLGLPVEWISPYKNSYETREAFERAL